MVFPGNVYVVIISLPSSETTPTKRSICDEEKSVFMGKHLKLSNKSHYVNCKQISLYPEPYAQTGFEKLFIDTGMHKKDI